MLRKVSYGLIIGMSVQILPVLSGEHDRLEVMPEATIARNRVTFNDGWKFKKSAPEKKNAGVVYSTKPVNDDSWKAVRVPHDWGVDYAFQQKLDGATGKLPWLGYGWYRKIFTIPKSAKGSRVYFEFDGVMANSDVWVNGKRIGGWAYGYTSFRVDATDAINRDAPNIIAVRAEKLPNSTRWYPGGGLYRNVWMLTTAPIAVGHWGITVTTPKATAEEAQVSVAVELDNQSGTDTVVDVSHEIYYVGIAANSAGQKVAEVSQKALPVSKGMNPKTRVTATLKAPKIWSLEETHMYCVVTTVRHNGAVLDSVKTPFGIRTVEFDPDKGCLINGKLVEIKGVCNHHDLGPLGAAVSIRALERQIELLQDMGCNSIRTAHNPSTPELLPLCDRMGMLVQVEAFDQWKYSGRKNIYPRIFDEWHEKDLRAMVRRDKNSPSVFMWSIGNEVL